MATVDIYLPIQSTSEWIHALSIPHEDIKRLTFRPLKWLRYATFAVCGAKGHLSATQGGDVVDYENVTFDDLADRYFYNPDDDVYRFVDYSAGFTQRRSRAAATRCSLKKIVRRDICCVITKTKTEYCAATHIIPKSKGGNYISFVIRDRSSLYDHLPFAPREYVDVNCIENGILLRVDLHCRFRFACIEFLKTPNFAMGPADVPRVERGPIPDDRTTLQYLVPPEGYYNVPPMDVCADWNDEVHPPPSILLDFMYGVAIAKHWASDGLRNMLEERYHTDFSPVLAEALADESEDEDETRET